MVSLLRREARVHQAVLGTPSGSLKAVASASDMPMQVEEDAPSQGRVQEWMGAEGSVGHFRPEARDSDHVTFSIATSKALAAGTAIGGGEANRGFRVALCQRARSICG